MQEIYNVLESENFFIKKIRETVKNENISFDLKKLDLLLTNTFDLPNSGLTQETLINLNNEVIKILRVAIKKDLSTTPKNEIKYIRTSLFKKFAMPSDWYNFYFHVYNNSERILNGLLQNLVIGNPFENQ